MASASHIGRQSRPNLRDFESFSELSRAVGLWGKGHFFGARSLYLGFYATFAKKRRFWAVFARLMNVTDRKYEVICTNGKIKGKHNGK